MSFYTTLKSDDGMCSQSVTVWENGIQLHSVILNNIYGLPIASATQMVTPSTISEIQFINSSSIKKRRELK
ncbi:hypothetical protein [Acinetobacter phage AB1I1M-1]